MRLALRLSGLQVQWAAGGRRCALNVVVVDAERMRELNLAFKHSAAATDVLAFEVAPDQSIPVEADECTVLGEIYICLEVARDAAQAYNTSVGYEVVLYAVHGMLHLAGLDDGTAAEKQRMKQAEESIMSALAGQLAIDTLF